MTDQIEKKKSYTQRLVDYLELKGTPVATINFIKDFAIEQYAERKKHEEDTTGFKSFGKYKGKKLQDVAKLDYSYLLWLAKNDEYLSGSNRELVTSLVVSHKP
jgi:uncharacterized protein (DUF3820 family)